MTLKNPMIGAAWVVVLMGGLLPQAGPSAFAAAPAAQTAAPGYYRMQLGSFEVTALSDGTAEFPVDKLLTGTTPARVEEALAHVFLHSPLETSGNAYLVNMGSKLILIDAGAGRLVAPSLGKLVANLRASGYRPEQVDDIYITHMHADHIGGLAQYGAAVFANATVHADRRDADGWLNPANMARARDVDKPVFEAAAASLAPYVKAQRFATFDGDTAFMPGFKAIATRGHTAGHSSFVLESGGQKLVFWGDLVHVAAIQMDQPSIGILFDGDAKAAAAQRHKVYADAAKGAYLVAASHIQFPGLGRLRVNGKGYAWVPMNYVLPP